MSNDARWAAKYFLYMTSILAGASLAFNSCNDGPATEDATPVQPEKISTLPTPGFPLTTFQDNVLSQDNDWGLSFDAQPLLNYTDREKPFSMDIPLGFMPYQNFDGSVDSIEVIGMYDAEAFLDLYNRNYQDMTGTPYADYLSPSVGVEWFAIPNAKLSGRGIFDMHLKNSNDTTFEPQFDGYYFGTGNGISNNLYFY